MFLMECEVSGWLFPMDTDASTVEDINIHQIMERLPMSALHLLKNGPMSSAIGM